MDRARVVVKLETCGEHWGGGIDFPAVPAILSMMLYVHSIVWRELHAGRLVEGEPPRA